MALTRSQNMARIRGKDTKPELLLRKELWRRGKQYRLHRKVAGCTPDFVYLSKKIAVFVDGCFWHGCPEHYTRPGTRKRFWDKKLRSNVERDIKQTSSLEALGWRVLRYWEHDVAASPEKVADAVEKVLDGAPAPTAPEERVIRVSSGAAEPGCETWTLVDLRGERPRRREVRYRTNR